MKNIKLNNELHKKLKIQAIIHNMSLQQFLEKILNEYLDQIEKQLLNK